MFILIIIYRACYRFAPVTLFARKYSYACLRKTAAGIQLKIIGCLPRAICVFTYVNVLYSTLQFNRQNNNSAFRAQRRSKSKTWRASWQATWHRLPVRGLPTARGRWMYNPGSVSTSTCWILHWLIDTALTRDTTSSRGFKARPSSVTSTPSSKRKTRESSPCARETSERSWCTRHTPTTWRYTWCITAVEARASRSCWSTKVSLCQLLICSSMLWLVVPVNSLIICLPFRRLPYLCPTSGQAHYVFFTCFRCRGVACYRLSLQSHVHWQASGYRPLSCHNPCRR